MSDDSPGIGTENVPRSFKLSCSRCKDWKSALWCCHSCALCAASDFENQCHHISSLHDFHWFSICYMFREAKNTDMTWYDEKVSVTAKQVWNFLKHPAIIKKSCGQTSKKPPNNHGWSQASDRHGQLDIHRRHCMAFSMQSLLQGHLVLMPLVWARHSKLHCDKDKGRNFAEKAHLVNETRFVGTFTSEPFEGFGHQRWKPLTQVHSIQLSSNTLW